MRTGSRFTHSDAIILIFMAGIVGWLWWQFPLAMLVTSIAAVVLFLTCCAVGSRSDGGI
jgi:hypothetical protein